MAQHTSISSKFPVLIMPYTDVVFNHETITPNQGVKSQVNVGSVTQQEETAAGELHKKGPKGVSRFMNALLGNRTRALQFSNRKMLTANGDAAYKETEPLVDLFHEMEESVDPNRLKQLLEQAWTNDADSTLRIIWNSRSIHLGKSNRMVFYRAVGWLAQTHPATLLNNLQWIVRAVIRKKQSKPNANTQAESASDGTSRTAVAEDSDSDFEIVEHDTKSLELRPFKRIKIEEPEDSTAFDVRYGVAHGYWKDLLNILVLSANNKLSIDCRPRDVLNFKDNTKKARRDWTSGRKHACIQARHEAIVSKLELDSFHRALHMRIAKLFADQLKLDILFLQSGRKSALKSISLAAKWAPSNRGSHDEHTFIASTIAELLHPFESVCPAGTDPSDRTLYLRYARAAYQSRTLSPLRKHLDVVERKIAVSAFSDIKYDRLPSVALRQYTSLFVKKDGEHFRQYLTDVAAGKSRISGAILLPSTMVAAARQQPPRHKRSLMSDIDTLVADGQWKTLIRRIKDSGTMQSAIAVCDVSGSMQGPIFPDHSRPIDAAIGLSLVLAEVCEPPFGGAFITFHEQPTVIQVGGEQDKTTFTEKVRKVQRSPWGGNTDFRAVFEDLILPMAIEHKLKQEEMVKRVFVFSDMHFDAARGCSSYCYTVGRHSLTGSDRWESSYQSIQKSFEAAGYEMPELVFWNLAGSTTGSGRIAPKPVDASQEGTALLSGYSQAMLKVFLDGGDFDKAIDLKDFEEDTVVVDKNGNEAKPKVEKLTPMAIVRKTIGHDGYRMLQVRD